MRRFREIDCSFWLYKKTGYRSLYLLFKTGCDLSVSNPNSRSNQGHLIYRLCHILRFEVKIIQKLWRHISWTHTFFLHTSKNSSQSKTPPSNTSMTTKNIKTPPPPPKKNHLDWCRYAISRIKSKPQRRSGTWFTKDPVGFFTNLWKILRRSSNWIMKSHKLGCTFQKIGELPLPRRLISIYTLFP